MFFLLQNFLIQYKDLSLKNQIKLKCLIKNFFLKRTQDLKEFYYDAAQFYIGWKNSWLQKKFCLRDPNKFVELDQKFISRHR